MAAVSFENVAKRFELIHARRRTIRDFFMAAFGKAGADVEEFWALRDVSFQVDKGETLGIIGPNGSGKSTILKLLSGTLLPNAGAIETNGRVFGLLELGAGFHPDLSGRENIFLNGSFLGIDRRSMARLYQRIVDFSELERFIDTPLKHYSSGMYMRLGFAIAIVVEPDILVIDEVLAVGDAAFARKCYEALSAFKKSGRTMLLVSHDPIQVRRFCDRVLWLEQGRVRRVGSARDVVQEYLQTTAGPATLPAAQAATVTAAEGGSRLQINDVVVDGGDSSASHSILPGQSVTFLIDYESGEYLEDVVFGCSIRRSDGLYVHESSSSASHGPVAVQPGRGAVACTLGPVPLGPGIYHVSFAAWPHGGKLSPFHLLRNRFTLFVGRPAAYQRGIAAIPYNWRFAAAIPAPAVPRPQIPQPDMTTPDSQLTWSAPPEQVRMGQLEEEHLGEGWHPVENWPPSVRWMGRRARLMLTQDVGRGTLVISACRPFHWESPLAGLVRVNGAEVSRFKVSGIDFDDIVIPLDPVMAPTSLQIELELDETFVPAAVGIDPDTRELGLAVREIRIE